MAAFPPTHEQRLRRLAEQVHALGPAPMLHAMRELEAGADLEVVLKRYAALPTAFVRDLGGDRFPDPVRLVQGGRS